MSMHGHVVAVNLESTAKNQKGESYPAWELVLRGPDGVITSVVRHRNTFKFTKGLEDALKVVKVGDPVTILMEKKGQFNNVVDIKVGEFEMPSAKPEKVKYEPKTNTYETAEERKVKQRLIVRQAAINSAIETLNGLETEGSVTAVLKTAEKYEEWVYRGME